MYIGNIHWKHCRLEASFAYGNKKCIHRKYTLYIGNIFRNIDRVIRKVHVCIRSLLKIYDHFAETIYDHLNESIRSAKVRYLENKRRKKFKLGLWSVPNQS